MKIISVSRRTDIPAFYGNWLMNRLNEGFAGYSNPFNAKKNILSLNKDDIHSLVLWSKNFSPFINNALLLKNENYHLFFNYTITGLPTVFEPCAPDTHESIESIKYLSTIFSPEQINWRYDPILISEITGFDFHINQFDLLCKMLSGYIKRCYISFPTIYGKVERSFRSFTKNSGISLLQIDMHDRILLAKRLSAIAESYGITIFSCCGDYLTGETIKKGHCIDGKLLSIINGKDLSKLKIKPTRKECGCTESTDIGIYDSCPHGCIYCYANNNSAMATSFYKKYITDPSYSESAFLGVQKEVSDQWLRETKKTESDKISDITVQPRLF